MRITYNHITYGIYLGVITGDGVIGLCLILLRL